MFLSDEWNLFIIIIILCLTDFSYLYLGIIRPTVKWFDSSPFCNNNVTLPITLLERSAIKL